MVNAVKDKVKDLKNFLFKRKIEYLEIEESDTSILKLKGAYISSRSSFFSKFQDYGIDLLTFEMIKKFLQEINMSREIDRFSVYLEKNKLNTLLTKMDRTIKNNSLVVSFKKNNTFGGYTETRKKIVLFDAQNEVFSQYLKIVPGINYHELAHVLFTCSFRALHKDLAKQYAEYDASIKNMSAKDSLSVINTILRIVNVFEDGRVESLMGNKVGTSIAYFKDTFYNFLFKQIQEKIDAGDSVDEIDCVLVAGRKYLDPEIRKWIFQKYIESNGNDDAIEDKAKRVNAYINKFVMCSWRKNRQEMIELTMGFFFEFVKPKLESSKTSEWENMIMKMLADAATSLNQMEDSDEEIDESEENILKKIIKETIENNTIPQKKKGKGTESDATSLEGSANNEESREPDDKVRDIINSDKQQIKKEIDENSKSLEQKLNTISFEDRNNTNFNDYPVTIAMKKDRMALEKKLKEFMSECRNGYDVRKKKGAVDIGEARRQNYRGGMKIFRQYRKNVRKALDIDVAFVLDCSYSMAGGITISKMNEASKQLWIASSACSHVGAKVKIFTFSDYYLGMVDQPKSNMVYRVPKYVNGTTISDTLCMAEDYLKTSQANTKWLIVLTDGAISDTEMHNLIVSRIKSKGVTCGKINLTDNRDYYYETNDTMYDHILKMSHNGDGNSSVLDGQNITTFFKKIYDISFAKTGRANGV